MRSNAEKHHREIISGIRKFFSKNSMKKAIIGLSGGIDSSLAAALAVEALGKGNVLGVIMPGRYSSKSSATDASRLAKNLGIKTMTVPIDRLYSAYIKEFAVMFRGMRKDRTEENIQARIRANILMAISNKMGHLVLATGNKSELYTGYCTLYGDLSGGLAPIADLFKTEVYETARYHNHLKGKEIIPKEIFEKEPSAELSPGQKDSDSLPRYGVLDIVLELILEKGLSGQRLVKACEKKGIGKETAERVLWLVRSSEFKRMQAPPAIILKSKAGKA